MNILEEGKALGVDFTPVASINVGLRWLTERGLKFTQDRDDLDDYDFAVLEIEGVGTVAFLHYHQSPPDMITFLLPNLAQRERQLHKIFVNVAKRLDLPLSCFHWQAGTT